MAVLAAGVLLWGLSVGPAGADSIRDGQWAIAKYDAAGSVWPVSQGDGVTVAVIDSGVMASHQDLAGQVLPGADFSGENTDGRTDKLGHGTEIASLIAARGHGDLAGVIGLAPKAKILPIRVALDESGSIGSGGETKIADAIRYAVAHGAKVINMSIAVGALRTNAEARQAVNDAIGKDVVLVAGTGNLGNQNAPVAYPAAFPGVVAVGAVDQQGAVWDKSDRGPEVTLVAPGVGIYGASNKSATSYGNGTGTSASTAYVSAIAALIRSKYPDLSAGQVINRMIKSAVAPPDHSQVPNNSYGYGIASPSKALAPNPAVDNGPKENPLAGRPESQGAPDGATNPTASQPANGGGAGGPGDQVASPSASGGVPVYVFAVGGVVALLVIVGVVLLVRRSGGGRNNGGPGGPGRYAPPTAAPPAPYNPGAQLYQPPQQPYPPQQSPYGTTPPPQPPPSGNPYH